MFNNVELLLNYVKILCKENEVALYVTASKTEEGDTITFKLEKEGKKLIVRYWLRDVIGADDLPKYFNEMDIHVKNINKLIKGAFIC